MSPLNANVATTRAVALAGATGLVGWAILEGLLADGSVMVVHALGRREPGVNHPKLTPLDEDYLALGTTIKAAGSLQGCGLRRQSSRCPRGIRRGFQVRWSGQYNGRGRESGKK